MTLRDALLAETPAIPSLSLHVRRHGQEVAHHTVGLARVDPARAAIPDQVYDLASVTKPLVGALLAMDLAARGADLDAPVARTLADAPPGITVTHLLQHTSGLPAWAPLHGATGRDRRAAVLAAASRVAPDGPPGTRHAYSDLGFLLLLRWIEAVGDAPIQDQFATRVAQPVMADLRWGWPGAAATENCPLRGRVVEGTVHDPNTDAMGGISTHAGLFGSAREVSRVTDAVLAALVGRPSPFDPAAMRRMASTRGVGSHVLGWDTPTRGGYTSTGRYLPDDAIGHLGYTGTSVWIVPSWDASIVLLTNRIHPVDDKAAIRAARPRIHDAVALHLGLANPPR